ncbi:FMN-linked oxidoreductase [Basidiobolus meristosporus CBS 931.73]|uniref:FMN-linked oxidoreductase n=1 Tax=Basidiobolus meristosporus CBS 931.73 TaxID=1314790 RepID=A0A1Y1WPY3_9FUNG|nr:FMN-linked oxidoreductase [Basidiobolus meristosporus CBS 931.73]ORX95172.1 FMN-linked oxidoreductase [Basidiobolus meristosporus CBS 931.73]|eukprot:ORX75348.1 FMN-linked oxidoreductase [Basidiobolus meristosporus CBS 931.73]
MSTPAIFSPTKLGNKQLKHRVVLAPLTRCRADANAVPTELMKEYYSQRATDGGLLITEATFITRIAGSYTNVPGIYTQDQIKAWKSITDAVHAKGGIIYLQLWHIGRAAIAALNEGHQPVSASNIPITGVTLQGTPEVPRALTIPEIKALTQDYRQAALNAIEAGFDGVEIHSANGYLLDQFINTSSNIRTDIYGGSIENRCRFSLEVVDAIVDAIGAERTAIRFSPWSGFQDMKDDTPYETWGYLAKTLQANHPDLAYLHFVEPRSNLFLDGVLETSDSLDPFRKEWKGTFISAGGYTYDAKLAFETCEKTGNLVAFGRRFIANPDLVERLRNDWPLNDYDRNTFYTGGPVGYTDYPFHQ